MTWDAAVWAFFGAILGGVVQHVLFVFNARVSRKMNLRKELETQISTAIDSLCELSLDYWCTVDKEADQKRVAMIYGQLEILRWLYPKMFEDRPASQKEVGSAVYRVRKALTKGDFAVSERSINQEQAIEAQLELARLKAIIQIEKVKHHFVWDNFKAKIILRVPILFLTGGKV